MSFDFISDPFVGVLVFCYIVVPPILAVFLVIRPLRLLLEGVAFISVVMPLVLGAVATGLFIIFVLAADVILKSKSVQEIVFNSEFSSFQDNLRNIPFSQIDAQFGPFSYLGLIENPCLLDYYTEKEFSFISNMLLGGFQKLACYSDWRKSHDEKNNTEVLIEKFLNEDLQIVREDLRVDNLFDSTLLELPKLVKVDSPNACTANARYNLKIMFNGEVTDISIIDHYNFEEIDPTMAGSYWNSLSISYYPCNTHCFTRRISIDLSNITTPLQYSEFAESYFSAGPADEISRSNKNNDRATEFSSATRSELEEELIGSKKFQKWFYSKNKVTKEDLLEVLSKTEDDFEEIAKGRNRRWSKRNWERPLLFEEFNFRDFLRPKWENASFASRGNKAVLFLEDDNIYFRSKDKYLIDKINQHCSAIK